MTEIDLIVRFWLFVFKITTQLFGFLFPLCITETFSHAFTHIKIHIYVQIHVKTLLEMCVHVCMCMYVYIPIYLCLIMILRTLKTIGCRFDFMTHISFPKLLLCCRFHTLFHGTHRQLLLVVFQNAYRNKQ